MKIQIFIFQRLSLQKKIGFVSTQTWNETDVEEDWGEPLMLDEEKEYLALKRGENSLTNGKTIYHQTYSVYGAEQLAQLGFESFKVNF